MSGVWAWIEHGNGAIKQIGLEVLGAGRTIADSLGQPLTALVFGDDVAAVSAAAFDYGADAVIAAADASLAHNRLEAIGPLVVKLAQERNPAVIMTGASLRGKDLTAWVAADLGAGLVPDGTALAIRRQAAGRRLRHFRHADPQHPQPRLPAGSRHGQDRRGRDGQRRGRRRGHPHQNRWLCRQ